MMTAHPLLPPRQGAAALAPDGALAASQSPGLSGAGGTVLDGEPDQTMNAGEINPRLSLFALFGGCFLVPPEELGSVWRGAKHAAVANRCQQWCQSWLERI